MNYVGSAPPELYLDSTPRDFTVQLDQFPNGASRDYRSECLNILIQVNSISTVTPDEKSLASDKNYVYLFLHLTG